MTAPQFPPAVAALDARLTALGRIRPRASEFPPQLAALLHCWGALLELAREDVDVRGAMERAVSWGEAMAQQSAADAVQP